MLSILHRVHFVLSNTSIFEIVQSIVRWIVIKMPDNRPLRARTYKRGHDQLMNLRLFILALVITQVQPLMPLMLVLLPWNQKSLLPVAEDITS